MIGTCRTDGGGHWSKKVCDVPILQLQISYLNEETLLSSTHGELRIMFDRDAWDVKEDGLIYTDRLFMKQFQRLLIRSGFSARAAVSVNYSEQGMQGSNFVSCDAHQPFLRECDSLFAFIHNRQKMITIYDGR